MTTASGKYVVLIAAKDEWRMVREHPYCKKCKIQSGSFPWFISEINGVNIPFIYSGCGKIAAASTTQYIIDKWNPSVLINLGSCGGFSNSVKKDDILLIYRTIIYDAHEIDGAILKRKPLHETLLSVNWIKPQWPANTKRACIATADQDLSPEMIPILRNKPFNAVAADWESGAIAYVAKKNNTRCLILRGVSDIICNKPSLEQDIHQGIQTVIPILLNALPDWITLLP